MAFHHITCVLAACDVCGQQLADPDTEQRLHFDTETEAQEEARSQRWPVAAGGRFICPTEDGDHAAELDALMPPEPVLPVCGQLDLDGGEAA